jgi:hypothetical protein
MRREMYGLAPGRGVSVRDVTPRDEDGRIRGSRGYEGGAVSLLVDRVCVVAAHQSCGGGALIDLGGGTCAYCPAGAVDGHHWLPVPCVPLARVRAIACAVHGSLPPAPRDGAAPRGWPGR